MTKAASPPARSRGQQGGDEARETATALLNLGADLLRQGEISEAIAYLELACGVPAIRALALANLGGAYILAGRHKQAIPLLEEARDAEPDNVMVWTNLGAAYLGNPVLASPEQQQSAIEAFERALELDPTAPNVHYNLGLIYVDRGEVDLACAAFGQAHRLNPADRDALFWLRKLERPENTGEEPPRDA